MQTACPHKQSTTCVIFKAAHSALQYFSVVVRQEHAGPAHFSAFAAAISFLPDLQQSLAIQCNILGAEKNYFCSKRYIFNFLLRELLFWLAVR